MTTEIKLTPASLRLFLALVKDAPNWSGCPLVEVSRQERGNLTDLKKAGLLTTQVDEGCTFAFFTDAGVALAEAYGRHPTWGDLSYPKNAAGLARDRAATREATSSYYVPGSGETAHLGRRAVPQIHAGREATMNGVMLTFGDQDNLESALRPGCTYQVTFVGGVVEDATFHSCDHNDWDNGDDFGFWLTIWPRDEEGDSVEPFEGTEKVWCPESEILSLHLY